jgi:broad specificity phosphatase PhoE
VSRQQTVWITRHGNRLDFVDPDWHRTAPNPFDPPLSEDGIVQAQRLGQRLRSEGIRRLYSSPFLRALETAQQVAECLDLPIKVEQGASEWLNPGWFPASPELITSGERSERIPRIREPDTSVVYPDFPESWEDLLARTARCINALVNQTREDILIVGHGASVLGFAQGLVGSTPRINAELCALVKIVHGNGGWRMELNGDTSFLGQSFEETTRFV